MKVSELIEASLNVIHSSPVECLGSVLEMICQTVGADYGIIMTVDQPSNTLAVDVLEGYSEEQVRAYRVERVKLPINEFQSVASKAVVEARQQGHPTLVVCSGDDPINYEIAPVEETAAYAVDSNGDFVSVLVLERKKGSSFAAFSQATGMSDVMDTCSKLISVALAAQQSFVFKFDEFIRQKGFRDFERLSKESVGWVYEKFRVSLCSLYFIEYDHRDGKDYLVCKEKVVNGLAQPNGEKARLGVGEDYAGWVAANKSSLISTTFRNGDGTQVTSNAPSPNGGSRNPVTLHQSLPASNLISYLGVPIIDGKHVIGVLEVMNAQREYAYSDEALLEMIACRIGSQYVRIARDASRENLFDIPNIETRDLKLVIRGVVEATMKVAAATHGLFMFKDEDGIFQPSAVCGHGLDKVSIQPVQPGGCDLTNWVMNNDNKPALVCDDITARDKLDPAILPYLNNSFLPRGFIPPNIRSLLMVPVYLKDATMDQTDDLGVLILMSLRTDAFQQDEVVITALAEIVSYHIWGNKKTAELESTSEKVSQLEQAMPHYSKAATAAAASAGTVHTARKHVIDVQKTIRKLREHRKVREDRELLELSRIIEKQFTELTDLYDKLHKVFRGSAPTFEHCNLAELVQEVRSYMDSKFKDRRIVFKNLIREADLPAVKADTVLMKVVFINLINNSIDAKARDITVSARRAVIHRLTGDDEEAVEVIFKDNGMGIKAENFDKIFDLFFTDEKKDGTGLGLAVNRDILDKHSGTIRVVSSTPGESTVFSLVWPLRLP